MRTILLTGLGLLLAQSAIAQQKVKLITLDPGHFHAALVQKSMYPQVDPTVHVYAKKGWTCSSILIKSKGITVAPLLPPVGKKWYMKAMIF